MVATQTKAALFSTMALALAYLGVGIKMGVVGSSVGAWVGFVFGVLILGITLALYIFDINCVINGGCMTWGWVKSVFLCIVIVILTVVTIVGIALPAKKDKAAAAAAAPTTTATPVAVATTPIATATATAEPATATPVATATTAVAPTTSPTTAAQ
jgi:hypothetical protein